MAKYQPKNGFCEVGICCKFVKLVYVVVRDVYQKEKYNVINIIFHNYFYKVCFILSFCGELLC